MKLKYEIETLTIGDELMAVPIESDRDFRGVLRMNDTTADILRHLETETTEDEIVAALLKEYDASEDEMRESVAMVVEQLRQNGLLAE